MHSLPRYAQLLNHLSSMVGILDGLETLAIFC